MSISKNKKMSKLNPSRKEKLKKQTNKQKDKLSWASIYMINCKRDQSSIQPKVLDFILCTRP